MSHPRILVLYAHPAPHRSRINRRLAEAARSQDGVLLHDLYETYPDFFIDVAREQALAAQAELLVFLHPLRWYSMPALLKEWVDSVLVPGWAYGPGTSALKGKGYLLAATTGSALDNHSEGEPNSRPFADFLPPFEQIAARCGMRWLAPHILHGANSASDAQIEAHVAAFRARLAQFLQSPANDTEHHGS